ncbi:MAG: hypothetical protein FJX77_06375, partial [Armatimonadetes bacterium]|nr:hypothetical protein [Armatimonadota bacterium]
MTVRAPLSVVVTWFVLWGACFPVGAVVGAQGGRAGQFLDVKGAVRLQRQTRELPVYLLTAAEVGDVVRVPADGYAELVLDLGGRRLQLLGGSVCRVEAAGVATLNGGAPTEKRRLAAATRLPRRGRGIAGQAFRSGVLIDENAPPTPCGGIRTAPVVLAWAGLEGALQGAQSLELQIREPGPEGKLLRCERL